MGKKKGHEVTDRDIANAFESLFDETLVPRSKEEAEEIISKVGIDPEKWNNAMYAMVQSQIRESPFNWRNVKKEEITKRIRKLESIPKQLDKTKEELQEMIQDRLNQLDLSPRQAPAAYRNREELTKEDLASLLQELEFRLREERGEI